VLVLSSTLRSAWLPITVALLASTVLAIAVTALVMMAVQRLVAYQRSEEKPSRQ
jgi:putative effector of murein hydrolase LrgA (UPF0299 family)